MSSDAPGLGAYGLELEGPLAGHRTLRRLPDPRGVLWLGDAEPGATAGPEVVEPGHVSLGLADGSHLDVQQDGDGRSVGVLYGGPPRSLDDLAHPYLAPVAALVHRWRGVPALHGAGLVSDAGSFGLVAAREQGKTTTAAALVDAGLAELLSDDLIVVDDGEVLPGPLSIDLRPAGSDLLGLTGDEVRQGERRRRLAQDLTVDGAADLTLRVLFHLRFGEETQVLPMSVPERLAALSEQLYWPGVGSGAKDLLGLASLPQFVLVRPRGRQGLTEAMDAMLTSVSAVAT